MSPDTGPLSVATPVHEYPAHSAQRLCVSFEFSPPKTEAMERTLWEAVTRLAPLGPTFFSVTYGAGGSTRQRTHDTVVRLKKETGIEPAAHLTCVGATRGEIDEIARAYWDAGIRHIVALRGDPPAGMGAKYTAASRRLRQCRRAGRRPEEDRRLPDQRRGLSREASRTRPTSRPTSRISSARSMPAPTRCITQFFFEADDFLRFRDRAAAAGIHVPVVPGIMPVSNFQSVTQDCRSVRLQGAELARPPVRGAGRRPRDAPHDRRHRRRRPLPAPAAAKASTSSISIR